MTALGLPPVAWDVGRVIAGGLLLYLGAEWLVRGAAGLARAFGVRPLVIGLTVVAYGTSAPELAVTLLAATGGKSAIALGNVVGSNIANLGLILGLTAIVAPPRVEATLIRREVPVLLAATLLLPVVLWDGEVSRAEGVLLALAAVAFTAVTIRRARRARPAPAEATADEAAGPGPASRRRGRLLAIALVGLAGLLLGGELFVDGAAAIAIRLGMSERVVGLTIVAAGTSLPELAASLVAALRGQPSLAIGNVVGSNIFNLLLILGCGALAHPIAGSLRELRLDLGALGGLTLAGAIALRGERRVTRLEGALLACGYAAFLALLAVVR